MFGELPIELPQRFTFVLLDNYSMLPVISAVDPLRLANRFAERELYRWQMAYAGDGPVSASNGLMLEPQIPLNSVPETATLVVCSGLDPRHNVPKSLISSLRKRVRRGADIGALCTGTHILGMAGILDGYTCTIHWENRLAFEEEFTETVITEHLFEIDRNRFTCAGGAAAMDMMLALIAEQHGVEISSEVAEQIIHSPIRGQQEGQRPSRAARIGMRHPRLSGILKAMDECIEDPVSPSQLAAEAGLSTRQLERLFRRYIGRSPKRYFLELEASAPPVVADRYAYFSGDSGLRIFHHVEFFKKLPKIFWQPAPSRAGVTGDGIERGINAQVSPLAGGLELNEA